jgi:hypothetical protein
MLLARVAVTHNILRLDPRHPSWSKNRDTERDTPGGNIIYVYGVGASWKQWIWWLTCHPLGDNANNDGEVLSPV